MKFLKNVLIITATFAVSSMYAKFTAKPAVAPAPAPEEVSISVPLPFKGALSYKQIHDGILDMTPDMVLDSSNRLNDTFINKMGQQAKASGLNSISFRALLQTARDKFVPFSGDDSKDGSLLQQINKQIDDSQLIFINEFSPRR